MASFYQKFVSNRTTEPDMASLLAQLHTFDITVGIEHEVGTSIYRIKKNSIWTPIQINSTQNIIDTAPSTSPQLTAQAHFDSLPLIERAIILVQLDQFNTIRAKLVPPLNAITEAQMFSAIRAKIGTL